MLNCACFIVDIDYYPPALALALRAIEATGPDVQVHVFVEGAGADKATIDRGAPTDARLRIHHNALSARIPHASPPSWLLPGPRQLGELCGRARHRSLEQTTPAHLSRCPPKFRRRDGAPQSAGLISQSLACRLRSRSALA
jgi:hypothetical protein